MRGHCVAFCSFFRLTNLKRIRGLPYLWALNSGNYVEFLIPVVVTVSEILPTRTVIPGIINSGSGNCFSGAWCVQGSPSARALGAQNRTSLPLRQGRALPLSPGADSKVVRAVLVPVVLSYTFTNSGN